MRRTRASWSSADCGALEQNMIEQPYDRGSAASILLPFFAIFRREPSARVLVVPAHHTVECDDVLTAAMLEASHATPGNDNRAVLLGIEPEQRHRDYPLIVPAQHMQDEGTRDVVSIEDVEDADVRSFLIERGALVSSQIFVAGTSAMLRLYDHALPGLLRSFLTHLRGQETPSRELLQGLYRFLPRREAHTDLLRSSAEVLRVARVDRCGFIDLERAKVEQAREQAAAQVRSALAARSGTMQQLGLIA
jgi:mannose-1-phosphate guanylyltransferase